MQDAGPAISLRCLKNAQMLGKPMRLLPLASNAVIMFCSGPDFAFRISQKIDRCLIAQIALAYRLQSSAMLVFSDRKVLGDVAGAVEAGFSDGLFFLYAEGES